MERISFIENDLLRIELTKGKHAIADRIDYDLLKNKGWVYNGWGYASATINYKVTTMHQFLMGKKPPLIIDHINKNPLDNRRSNLRFTTRSINCLNSDKWKGYSFSKEKRKFIVNIKAGRKCYYLGAYKTETEAKLVADRFRKRVCSEFYDR